MNKQQGFIEDVVLIATGLFIALVFLLVLTAPFAKVELSRQTVSGVVYNTKNDVFISGNTTFSVRASEDTYVSEENRSSYCLPPGSPYIKLVNEAARNKDIKVVVTTEKAFEWAAPWTCIDNVKVERR